MMSEPAFLLLQVRNDSDEMAAHELTCFSESLECDPARITTCNLLHRMPTTAELDASHVVLVGGSGDYSVTDTAGWLDATYDLFRTLCRQRKPMFGSCWGFQAIAKALGGTVQKDSGKAELGTIPVTLTAEGQNDPVFGPLGHSFYVPIGHEDSVISLPENCTLLGTSAKANQIYRCEDAPVYATQFHPELTRDALIQRIKKYPKYVEEISGSTFDAFAGECQETPKMKEIMPNFVAWALEC